MKRYVLFILVVLVGLNSSAVGQTGIPSEGREFYLGILYPSYLRQTTSTTYHTIKYNAYLLITATADALVDVNYFDANGKETSNTAKIAMRGGTQVQLDLSKFNLTDTYGERAQYSTCHLVSPVPISVQFVSVGSNSGGSYLALPVQCLGKKYVVQSYNDNPSGTGGMMSTGPSRGCFEVIAAYDGTQVTITPSTTTASGKPGAVSGVGSNGTAQPFSVGLSRGQTYTVFSQGSDPNGDLTGSVISSNKPVVVLAGHEDAFPSGSSDQLQWSEGRDFMVEQLMPTECWDNKGYATIPLVDSKPSTASGAGDELRVVSLPSNGNSVLMANFVGSPRSTTPSNYGSFSIIGNLTPVSFSDDRLKPFAVMRYDQRMQGTGAPYPAPSMSGVVPRSHWKSEYYFDVQNTKFGLFQGYLYIIAPKADWNSSKILMGFNGGSPSPLATAGVSVKHSWASIPGDSTLMGVAVAMNNAGSYYIVDVATDENNPTLRSSFGAYYNATAVDYGWTTTGPPSYYDDCFSYANPLGMTYGDFGAKPPVMSATVKNECGYWSVCVSDVGDSTNGIRYIDLLNYPKGTFVTPIRASTNAKFDESLDPLGKNEIILPGTDGEFCFRVIPINPADSTRSFVEVYDNSGASILISLTSASALTATSSGDLQRLGAQRFSYPITAVDTPRCGTLAIGVPSDLGAHDMKINSIVITGDTARFHFSAQLPSLPVTIHPGAPLQLGVCFTPNDTSTAHASVLLLGDCDAQFAYSLEGNGASGMLRVSDVSYPLTNAADTNCDVVLIQNVGTRPIRLESSPTLSDPVNFSIDPAFLASLPRTLAAGQSVTAKVCFVPVDAHSHTCLLDWASNMTPAIEARSKHVSVLKGRGYAPEIEWSPDSLALMADSLDAVPTDTRRIYLANRGAEKRILVRSIALSGLDSADFSIGENEYGVDPLTNFYINSSDSMWVEVVFKPSISAPYPDRFATRNSYIIARYDVENSSTVNALTVAPLSGAFGHLDNSVSRSADVPHGNIRVFASTTAVGIFMPESAGDGPFDCTITDLLGRTRVHEVGVGYTGSGQFLLLDHRDLESGTYFVRVTDGHKFWVSKLSWSR